MRRRRRCCKSLEDKCVWQFKCSLCVIVTYLLFWCLIKVLIFVLWICLFRLASNRPIYIWRLLFVALPFCVRQIWVRSSENTLRFMGPSLYYVVSTCWVRKKRCNFQCWKNKTLAKPLRTSSKQLRTKGFTRNILPSPFSRVFQGVKEAVFIITMATTVPHDIRCWKLIWRQQLTRERHTKPLSDEENSLLVWRRETKAHSSYIS
jgi:hypothetical protein